MEHDVIDDLEPGCAPPVPQPPAPTTDAFDAELLARVREQPVPAPHRFRARVAAPVAAGVTVTAVAVVMLGRRAG